MFSKSRGARGAIIITLVGLFSAGCADTVGEELIRQKNEAFNPGNRPERLGFPFRFELADASLVGQTLRSSFAPYRPPGYFPFTSDGINKRQSASEPSAAEKYDLAFSGWAPPASFWSLDRLTGTSDKEFDQAYYDQLGPVARWEHQNHGLGPMHDGVDNDGDDRMDLADSDGDGLQGWFGYCNGNTSAAISVPGPVNPVTVGEVTFHPRDIMALLAAVHYDDRSTMTGLRCEANSPRTDDLGRVIDQPWYRFTDTPEAPLALFEVVNGPGWMDEAGTMVGYVVQLSPGEGAAYAVIRLPYAEFVRYGEETFSGELALVVGEELEDVWRPVEFSTAAQGCRDTNPATLYLAVTHLLGRYQVPFAIDADAGAHVWNYPISEAVLVEQTLIDQATANQKLGIAAEEPYPYNDRARGFAYVRLNLTETHSMSLEMVLELDENDQVIGGEWVGGSRTRHPDFIWVAMGADRNGFNTAGTYVTFGDDQLDGDRYSDGRVVHNDAPGLRYSDVRQLLARSRVEGSHKFFSLPDAAELVVPAQGTISRTVRFDEAGFNQVVEALAYLDLASPAVDQLRLTLTAPDGTSITLFEVPTGSGFSAGRAPQGLELGVISGVAHPVPLVDDQGAVQRGLKALEGKAARGDWTLQVENRGAAPATLKRWSLWLTAAP